MNQLQYENLKFLDFDNERIKVIFKERYYFFLEKSDLIKRIGKFEIDKKDNSIIYFNAPLKRAQIRFDDFIDFGLDDLYNSNKDKKTIYIYEDLIPLIGTNEFGIVDRNTSIIEIKPLTGCNLSCVFCSVSEGVNDKIDYLIEPNYLIDEVKKLIDLKKSKEIEINIGPQGEPLLYPDIFYLIKELKKIEKIKIISMNSNGRLLTKETIKELIESGLDRINLSVHNYDDEQQKKLSGTALSIKRLKELIAYADGKLDFLLAPVYIPKINEDIEELILFAKEYKKNDPLIGIQNFLNYKGGRNPVKQKSFEEFYDILQKLEIKHKVKLILNQKDFNILPDKVLEKPFKKGQIIDAIIKIPARKDNELIAEAENRAITVFDCKFEKNKKIRIKLLRDKHNIFNAVRA
jgi:uncharacterized protein